MMKFKSTGVKQNVKCSQFELPKRLRLAQPDGNLVDLRNFSKLSTMQEIEELISSTSRQGSTGRNIHICHRSILQF